MVSIVLLLIFFPVAASLPALQVPGLDTCEEEDAGLSAIQLRGDKLKVNKAALGAGIDASLVSSEEGLASSDDGDGSRTWSSLNASSLSEQASGFCSTLTGDRCRLGVGCFGANTECFNQRCRCRIGFCAAEGGNCVPAGSQLSYCVKTTTGTCLVRPCARGRGRTRCTGTFNCECAEDRCADDYGICRETRPPFITRVVPINPPRGYTAEAQRDAWPLGRHQVITALCLMGGGSRALSFAMGVLRALRLLRAIRSIDAISSNSGGSWAAAIFMFAPARFDDEALLGKATEYEDFTPGRLYLLEGPKRVLARGATRSFGEIALQKYSDGTLGSQLWVESVAEAVLKPYGLGDLNKFVAATKEEAQAIIARNPAQLGWDMSKFYIQRESTPDSPRPGLWLALGAVLAPYNHKADRFNVVPYEFASDFSGVPMYPKSGKIGIVPYRAASSLRGYGTGFEALVGGGLIENFAAGSDVPIDPAQQLGGLDVDVEVAAPPDTMSLGKMIAISSAAHAAFTPRGKLPAPLKRVSRATRKLSLKAYLWPVTRRRDEYPVDLKTKGLRYTMGDGGIVENLALLPMLQRGATRLLVAASIEKAITNCVGTKTYNFCRRVGAGKLQEPELMADPAKLEKLVDRSILSVFGMSTRMGSIRNPDFRREGVNNQVFEEEELWPLLCKLSTALQAGRPPVVLQTLTLMRNDWWGIKGGYEVSVIWVFNQVYKAFKENLPRETRKSWKGPNVGTLGSTFNGLSWTDVALIAANAEHSLRAAEALVVEMFPDAPLDDQAVSKDVADRLSPMGYLVPAAECAEEGAEEDVVEQDFEDLENGDNDDDEEDEVVDNADPILPPDGPPRVDDGDGFLDSISQQA